MNTYTLEKDTAGDGFTLTIPSTATALQEAVKALPGAAWNGERNLYTLPAHRRTARALRAVLTTPDAKALTPVITSDVAMQLRALADVAEPDADVTLAKGESGETVVAITTPHSIALRDSLKKMNASWVNNHWEVPIEKASALQNLATAQDLHLAPDVIEMAERNHGAFDYDGTIDGLRGVPVAELSSVPTKARGKQASLNDRFKEFGVESIYDLLMTVPRRYLDRSSMKPIRELPIGEDVGVIATVTNVGRYDKGKRLVRHIVSDGTGTISITFFSSPWQAFRFKEGDKVAIWGKLDVWEGGSKRVLQMTNPVMDPLDDETALIVPIYPQSAKNSVTTWDLHTSAMEAVKRLGNLADPVPADITSELELIPRIDAYRQVHHPDSITLAEEARKRLAFDEFLRMQLALLMAKYAADDSDKGVTHAPDMSLAAPYIKALPYQITGAQRRGLREIADDLQAASPMHRLLQGDVGSGKAQPLDAMILTPTGFVPMGDIRVGDEVINPTGEVAVVRGVFPQGVRDVWRIHFSDGTSVRADDEHLWSVRTTTMRAKGRAAKIMTTRQIREDLREKNGASKWYVELAQAAELDDGGERPLDPYLLGVLLGDGYLGNSKGETVSITSADEDLIEGLAGLLPEGTKLRRQHQEGRCDFWRVIRDRPLLPPLRSHEVENESAYAEAYERGYSIQTIAGVAGVSRSRVRSRLLESAVELRPSQIPNPMNKVLQSLGLWGRKSHDKFVPQPYLNAPLKDRVAILQGLMDTDGTVSRHGTNCSYSTVSHQLAEDVAWLARSLGGRSRVMLRNRKSGVSWHVSIQLPNNISPFRLSRKAAICRPRTKYANPARAIVDVTFEGPEPVQCISVTHENQLYVTDNFTVTHNTTVAAVSLLMAVEGGHQGALMAPTDILAWQLYREVQETTADLTKKDGSPVSVEYLSGKTRVKERRRILEGLANGDVDILVGTHALLTPDVQFSSLGLVIIDEQHRFGVEQRAKLREKSPDDTIPDMLVMTATPIPRTSAMTVYGDLDLTILDELPPGRTPIATEWIRQEPVLDSPLAHPWDMVLDQIAQGRQAYVVCPLVEESEKMQAASATETFDALTNGALTGLRVGLVHGQMPPAERDETMAAFKAGELDVIVATTVIEVGVNVPNASIIVILDAPRFGLAQLHQLRGRVGRAQHASFCYLVGDPNSAEGVERMKAMVRTTSGFELAEVDAKLRGVGAVYGSRQAGQQSDLRVGDIRSDLDLIIAARSAASKILENNRELLRQPVLRMEVMTAVGPEAAAWLSRS